MKTEATSMPISALVLNENLLSCAPSTSVLEAVRMMAEENVGSIVIMEKGRPVGIFTERDYLKKIGATEEDLRSEQISKFMTPNPKSLPVNAPILRAMILMRLGRFRHILLHKPSGEFVGILSIKDVLNFLCDSLSDGPS